MQEKALASVHSVGLEPTKLILIDTRTTYHATGDTGLYALLTVVPRNSIRFSVLSVCVSSNFVCPAGPARAGPPVSVHDEPG